MSLPLAPAAYRDCYELFALATRTPGGIRSPFPTREAATYHQMRMNQARVILRNMNKRAYTPDHPLYNTSEYDHFKIQIKGPDDNNEFWTYITLSGDWHAVANAEPIPDDEMILPPFESPRRLTISTEYTTDATVSDDLEG